MTIKTFAQKYFAWMVTIVLVFVVLFFRSNIQIGKKNIPVKGVVHYINEGAQQKNWEHVRDVLLPPFIKMTEITYDSIDHGNMTQKNAGEKILPVYFFGASVPYHDDLKGTVIMTLTIGHYYTGKKEWNIESAVLYTMDYGGGIYDSYDIHNTIEEKRLEEKIEKIPKIDKSAIKRKYRSELRALGFQFYLDEIVNIETPVRNGNDTVITIKAMGIDHPKGNALSLCLLDDTKKEGFIEIRYKEQNIDLIKIGRENSPFFYKIVWDSYSGMN